MPNIDEDKLPDAINSIASGVTPNQPTFETKDLDFVAFMLSKAMYAITASPEGIARPIRSRVRLADLVPYSDSDATSPYKSIRYVFVLQSEDPNETAEQLSQRMRHLELLFLNKQTLIEAIGFTAWRRQLRSWMTETDQRRKLMLKSMDGRVRT